MPFFIIEKEQIARIDQVISVDLLNSFLPEVWYSLVLGTGKRYRKEKTICQYSQISSGTSNVWGYG